MKSILEALRQAFRTTVGGLWLVALLVGTIWISVGSLAAIQVRTDLTEAEKELSFNDVARAYDKYTARKEIIDRRLINANPQANAFAAVDEKVVEIAVALGKGPDIDPIAFEVTSEFGEAYAACRSDHRPTEPADGIEVIVESGSGPDAPPAEQALAKDDLCGLFNEHEQLTGAALSLDESSLSELYEKVQVTAQAQIDELQSNEPLFKHFSAYDFFRLIKAPFLLVVPAPVLVLVVTMAMGVLGSVLTMTWLFIRQDGSMTLRRFLTLPLIGAVSAFVVFIFVKAGQLTLTAGNTEDTLNPFVLSFVGVISGMLSERAYNRITDVGTSFFDVDDGQPRWGSRIKEAMCGIGVSEAELARYLGVTEEEAARIVNESTTATFDQQRLIAACLRRTVRELFTDVPPDAPSAIAAGPTTVVPDLRGLDAAGVLRALRDAGLRIGDMPEVEDATVAAGVVVAQTPAAGVPTTRLSAVDVTVAKRGPQTPPAEKSPSEGPPDTGDIDREAGEDRGGAEGPSRA